MPNSTAPLDLLRKHRRCFELEAAQARRQQKEARPGSGDASAAGARAYAWEHAISEIDDTLRDWA